MQESSYVPTWCIVHSILIFCSFPFSMSAGYPPPLGFNQPGLFANNPQSYPPSNEATSGYPYPPNNDATSGYPYPPSSNATSSYPYPTPAPYPQPNMMNSNNSGYQGPGYPTSSGYPNAGGYPNSGGGYPGNVPNAGGNCSK